MENLKNELEKLNEEDNQLNNMINTLKSHFEKFSEENDFKKYGYVTFDDIKSLTEGEDVNLIAIKAPVGTSLEIPDPDQIHSIYTQTREVRLK